MQDCIPLAISPRRIVHLATPAMAASSPAIPALWYCSSAKLYSPVTLSVLGVGKLSQPLNSSCWAYSRDIRGIWLGANVFASVSACSHCSRSRLISRAARGLEEDKNNFCASVYSPSNRQICPASKFFSSIDCIFCRPKTMLASPACLTTLNQRSVKSYNQLWIQLAIASSTSSCLMASFAKFTQ